MINFGFNEVSYRTDRIIGDLQGQPNGPTVVFIGGIHGNEPSGVIAIQRLFDFLKQDKTPIRGRVLGIVGNMAALACSKRALAEDLNRIWNQDFFQRYYRGCRFESSEVNEYREACEVFDIIAPLLENSQKQDSRTSSPDLYFFDLHTTSAETVPFIAINDQLDNRRIALKFPVPVVLGIEEYLKGPLLSYINDIGPVAMAYEAGKHGDPASTDLHFAFAIHSLVLAGVVQAGDIGSLDSYLDLIKAKTTGKRGIFEVIHRHPVSPNDDFQMIPGFTNFMQVRKGQHLANDRNGPVLAPREGRVFMPLYQPQGDDGFFIVRAVPYPALQLSSLLRRYNFERLLEKLPGISRSPVDPDALVVNKRVALFLASQIFHLLGYRRKRDEGKTMTFVRREVGRIDDRP